MTALNKTASAIALVLAGTFTTSALATGKHGGDIYYPENPNPSVPTPQPVTNNNNNNNHNAANAAANASAAAQAAAAAIAAQQQAQQQSLNNANTATANGGAGGSGGQGGAGGRATSNATGGTSSAITGASTSSATNGSATSGNSQVTTFEAAKQVGNAPAVYLNPTGDCGEGFSLSVGFIGGAVGGGSTTQSRTCLSQKAAMSILNAGIVLKDDGMIVASMETLAGLHPEVKAGLEASGVAFNASCIGDVLKRSRVLAVGLTEEKCNALRASFTPPASPAVAAAPVVAPVVTVSQPDEPAALDCGKKPVVFNPVMRQYACGNDLD